MVFEADSNTAILVDIGEYGECKAFLSPFSVEALLLTHAHYDHIYHINELLQDHPGCRVFASQYTIDALANPKLNLSFYHEDPVSYRGNAVKPVEGGCAVALIENTPIEIIATPGHTTGCLTYQIGPYLFTGDAFIPGYKVVTKLKGGDRTVSAKSVALIKSKLSEGVVLCPGHGSAYRVEASNALSEYF